MSHNFSSLEECLIALGCINPFDDTGNSRPFTETGMIAYEDLRSILSFMESQGVVENFSEDRLDMIADGYSIY